MDSEDDNQFTYSQQTQNTPSLFHANNMSQPTMPNTLDHLSFPPNYFFHPNVSYNSHLNQQFGSAFSYQGLLNASNTSFESQNTSSTKRSNKGKTIQRSADHLPPLPKQNWTKVEDVALTRAWLYISVDADIGNNQKNATMWERVFIAWKDNMGVGCNSGRNSNSLNCRWTKIQSAVNKFQGIYERLERHPQSGTTPEFTKKEAMRMYEETYDGQFNFEHCWELMVKNPKWCSKELTKTNEMKRQKMRNSAGNQPLPKATQKSNSNEDEDDVRGIDNVNVGNECDNSNEVERSQGRKACKDKKRRLNEDKIMADALNNLQSTLEKQLRVQQEEMELKKEKDRKDFEFQEQVMKKEVELKEKAQELKRAEIKVREKAERREQQNRIMNQDLNKLPLSIRETYERYQAEILKEWENDGLFASSTV